MDRVFRGSEISLTAVGVSDVVQDGRDVVLTSCVFWILFKEFATDTKRFFECDACRREVAKPSANGAELVVRLSQIIPSRGIGRLQLREFLRIIDRVLKHPFLQPEHLRTA